MNNALLFFYTNDIDELGPCIFYLSNLFIPLFFLFLSRPNIKTWINTNMTSLSNKGSQSCSGVRHYNSLGFKSWYLFIVSSFSNLSFIIAYLTPLWHPHMPLLLCLRNLIDPISNEKLYVHIRSCNSSFIVTCFLSKKYLLIKTSSFMYQIPPRV